VLVSPRVAEPFVSGGHIYEHGLTFSGHPLTTAIASAALDVYEDESVLDAVRENEPHLRHRLEELRGIPLVGDVRGAGFFWALELVAVQVGCHRGAGHARSGRGSGCGSGLSPGPVRHDGA
jgi:adenosylmethionine-8-amino-7-oxononanoate aminotransferase